MDHVILVQQLEGEYDFSEELVPARQALVEAEWLKHLDAGAGSTLSHEGIQLDSVLADLVEVKHAEIEEGLCSISWHIRLQVAQNQAQNQLRRLSEKLP